MHSSSSGWQLLIRALAIPSETFSIFFFGLFLLLFLQLPSKHMCESFTCCVSIYFVSAIEIQSQTMFDQQKLLSHFKHIRQIVPFDE